MMSKFPKKIRDVLGKLNIVAFLMPSLIGVIIFYLAPFLVVIFYSVVDNPVSKKFVAFSNFIDVLGNGAFKLAALNTLKFSLMSVPLAVIISLLIALLLDNQIPLASQFRSAYLTPMMVPAASVVLIFKVLFDYNGVVNIAVRFFGGSNIDWLKSNYAPYVVLALFLWKNLGYDMILFLSALSTIPKEMIEVAQLDTTSPIRIFFLVKIRYLSPTMVFVAIMSLINSFKVFREVYLLSGSYPYDSLYTLQHFMNNTFNSFDYQKLSAAAIIMGIVMSIVIAGLYIFEQRFGKDIEED